MGADYSNLIDGDNAIIRDHFINCSCSGRAHGKFQCLSELYLGQRIYRLWRGADNMGFGGEGQLLTSIVVSLIIGAWPISMRITVFGSVSGQTHLLVPATPFLNDEGAQSQNAIVLQNNKILDSYSTNSTIAVNELGKMSFCSATRFGFAGRQSRRSWK